MSRWRGLCADVLAFRHRVTYSDDGCWLWQPPLGYGGYGIASLEGEQVRAHVAAYRLMVDRSYRGQVHHACSARSCVNPAHLRAVSCAPLLGSAWLEANINRTGATPECLIWPRRVNSQGYGVDGWGALAHRAAWEKVRGAIPPGLIVMHSCDCPPCVNLDHLSLGTPADNNRDRDRKGRHAPLRGEAHGQAVLTEAQVLEIRRVYRPRSRTHGAIPLAARYGVSSSTIQIVVRRKVWAHVA